VLHNRVHWAKYYMSKAGLIDSPARGRFIASEAGKRLLATKPEKLDTQSLMQIPVFAKFYGRNGQSSGDIGGKPSEEPSSELMAGSCQQAALLSVVRVFGTDRRVI